MLWGQSNTDAKIPARKYHGEEMLSRWGGSNAKNLVKSVRSGSAHILCAVTQKQPGKCYKTDFMIGSRSHRK